VFIVLYRPYQVYARLYWSGSLEVFTGVATDLSFVYRWISGEADIHASDTEHMVDTDQVVTVDEILLEEEEKPFSEDIIEQTSLEDFLKNHLCLKVSLKRGRKLGEMRLWKA